MNWYAFEPMCDRKWVPAAAWVLTVILAAPVAVWVFVKWVFERK